MQALNFSDLAIEQLQGAEFMLDNPRSAIWMLMGRGKTITALTALKYMKFDRCLVVAPPHVAHRTWPDEIERWSHIDFDYEVIKGSPEKRHKLLEQGAKLQFMSLFNLPWLCKIYNTQRRWQWDIVIIDESGFFRSLHNRYRAINRCRTFVKKFYLMTGTPAANSYEGLWPQFHLLDSGERLGGTLTIYREDHFTRSFNGFSYELASKYEPIRISQKISDITYVVLADDSTLPDKVETETYIDLDPKNLKAYKELKKECYLELVDETGQVNQINPENAGVQAGKLLQMSSGAIYFQDPATDFDIDGEPILPPKRVIEFGNEKIKALEHIIESLQGQPLLLAYSHHHERDRIGKLKGVTLLKQKGVKSDEVIQAFQRGEVQVLATHPQSIGYGMNLQHSCCNTLWFSLPHGQNEDYQQFNFRTWRKGQKNKVTINHLIARGTYDEIALANLRKKQTSEKVMLEFLDHLRE